MIEPYYQQVSQAFDQAAQDYDELYRENPIMAWMRAESLAALRATFPAGSRLLEIGCGTGEEALVLGRQGYAIVATDISPAMIETAGVKAQREGIQDVIWRVLPAGQIGELALDEGPAAFDGAYASFGALNCEPDLNRVAAALATLMRADAPLLCSVMNRWCAWEIGWGLVHLQIRRAFRRLGRNRVEARLASPAGPRPVPVYYHTPRGFAHAFTPHFRLQKVFGLPVILPPPYLAHIFSRHRNLFARLETFELRLRHRLPFYALGDHFLAVLTRTGAES